MEDAVAAVGSDRERLGIVLEGVGRRLGTDVADVEPLALLGPLWWMLPGATLPATRRWRT
jgi:hypothetical protein